MFINTKKMRLNHLITYVEILILGYSRWQSQERNSSLKPKKWEKRSLLMAVSSLGTVHYKIIHGSVKHTAET
jgi:hypothetical protein